MTRDEIIELVSRIQLNLMGKRLELLVREDTVYLNDRSEGRLYLQVSYRANDATKPDRAREQEWRGRKWYLSEHMLDDEVVKTAFAAFRAAVEHEVMEGFTVQGIRVFNPHTPFWELGAASVHEVKRP